MTEFEKTVLSHIPYGRFSAVTPQDVFEKIGGSSPSVTWQMRNGWNVHKVRVAMNRLSVNSATKIRRGWTAPKGTKGAAAIYWRNGWNPVSTIPINEVLLVKAMGGKKLARCPSYARQKSIPIQAAPGAPDHVQAIACLEATSGRHVMATAWVKPAPWLLDNMTLKHHIPNGGMAPASGLEPDSLVLETKAQPLDHAGLMKKVFG